jgi:hypothetical protein
MSQLLSHQEQTKRSFPEWQCNFILSSEFSA